MWLSSLKCWWGLAPPSRFVGGCCVRACACCAACISLRLQIPSTAFFGQCTCCAAAVAVVSSPPSPSRGLLACWECDWLAHHETVCRLLYAVIHRSTSAGNALCSVTRLLPTAWMDVNTLVELHQ
jgi:hypothetical protein